MSSDDDTLTEKGTIQNRMLISFLKTLKLDVVISSPTSRTISIAKELNRPFLVEPLLNERDIGPFKGRKKSEFFNFCKDNKFSFETCKTDLIEDYEAVFERANKFKDFLVKHYRKKSIVIISHSSVLIALLCALLDKKSNLMYITSLQNVSVSHIVLEDDLRPVIKYINSTAYLFK